jgi:hypothetical protein
MDRPCPRCHTLSSEDPRVAGCRVCNGTQRVAKPRIVHSRANQTGCMPPEKVVRLLDIERERARPEQARRRY